MAVIKTDVTDYFYALLYNSETVLLPLANRNNMKIYIAGPYTASTPDQVEANVNRAIDAAIAILSKGHIPYIPHLTHFVDLRSKETNAGLKWEDYIEWDTAWLEECDALLYLGESRGAKIEFEHAKNLGLKIFYKLEEIPVVKKTREIHFKDQC